MEDNANLSTEALHGAWLQGLDGRTGELEEGLARTRAALVMTLVFVALLVGVILGRKEALR